MGSVNAQQALQDKDLFFSLQQRPSGLYLLNNLKRLMHLTLASSSIFLSQVALFQAFCSLFLAPVSHLGLKKPRFH